MFDTLIINARRDLGWGRRAASDLSTAMLWIGWILLWAPVFRKLREVVRLHLQFELAAREILEMVTPISVVHSVIALLGTITLLLSWSLLPKRRVAHAHAALTSVDHARHFGVDERQVAAGLQSRICVVHHDDDGAVTGITAQYPLVQVPSMPVTLVRIPQREAA
ncbi:poly-beta-1,6-N-acetyl-D-glucosamine biosynthesis protein PgaD [Cognatiluteimonas profundi]|uniref:poly-beta-1,6-N-acetyl-D-glucosamine biosynthesis protein PgaD n=1 Tax=Cognatiluteimonas profundi TaxID=2594501 RepID=UPI00131E74EF|nr:poly-beta-1,6-N-acetyl-D-glucosamine biosynthesis protein PgaD [Lysobacter profundi]